MRGKDNAIGVMKGQKSEIGGRKINKREEDQGPEMIVREILGGKSLEAKAKVGVKAIQWRSLMLLTRELQSCPQIRNLSTSIRPSLLHSFAWTRKRIVSNHKNPNQLLGMIVLNLTISKTIENPIMIVMTRTT